jgi:hypothetical protein
MLRSSRWQASRSHLEQAQPTVNPGNWMDGVFVFRTSMQPTAARLSAAGVAARLRSDQQSALRDPISPGESAMPKALADVFCASR